SGRLPLHGAPVLLDEHAREDPEQRDHKRHPAEDVPGGAKVNAAAIYGNGSHCRPAGEPIRSAPNFFETHIGQYELDGGSNRLAVNPKQLVKSAVGGGRVRLDTKAVGNGLEHLLLLVDAVPAPPPPGLMNEWTMGGVHQPDDAVVDVAGQLRCQPGNPIRRAEYREARHRRRSVLLLGMPPGLRNIRPAISVLLLAREAHSKDS